MLNKEYWDVPFPKDMIDLQVATSTQIESIVKFLFQLQKSYAEGRKLVAHRIQTSLVVTWVKIIHGHFFVVAASNEIESKISVWTLDGSLVCCAEYYLPGPVVDGYAYDSTEKTILGVTIGTRSDLCLCVTPFI